MASASKRVLSAATVLLSVAFAQAAGSARLGYSSVSPSTCPENCAMDGYNAAWDAGGKRMNSNFTVNLFIFDMDLAYFFG